MSSQLWSRFRKLRAIIFGESKVYLFPHMFGVELIMMIMKALSTLLSIAWTVIFTILLIREWNAYNVGQRE